VELVLDDELRRLSRNRRWRRRVVK